MDNNFRRYYVDWWSIRKSTIYAIVAIVVTLFLLAGGVWWLWQNDWVITSPEELQTPKDAASIVSFEGNVRIIRVSTRATERVTRATFVEAGDTVQTQADGRAQIRMIDGSILSVRPNSTVVISDSTSILGGTSVKVKLDDGQINLRTQNQNESSNNVVEIKETQNKMLAQTEASFNINQSTKKGEIRINRGGLESTIGNEKVVVNENEFFAIGNDKTYSKEKLLRPPKQREPLPSMQIFSNGNNTSLTFVWDEPSGHAGINYSLQLAQSPFFVKGKLVAEKGSIANESVVISGLMPGNYFWRVRASIKSGQTSEWSDPQKFMIIKREGSASIPASKWEVEDVGSGVYFVSGVTRPGATVEIMQREMFAKSDGSFRIQVSSGATSVIVGISDEKGNRSQYEISLKTGVLIR